MIPVGWILVILALNLVAPILWVGFFNFIGLKRILERLGDLEAESDQFRNKARSLQSQIGRKKNPEVTFIDRDEKIAEEIRLHMHSTNETIGQLPINRGGIRNADPDRISESS